jgi:hypothetical protein
MIWYILLAVFFIGGLIVKRHELFKGRDRGEEWFIFLFQTFCVAFFGFLIGAFISTWFFLAPGPATAYPLVAVDDGSKVQGASFLFSGYVDQSQVYNYYERTGPNGYLRGWQYAQGTPVIEDAPAGTANLTQYYLVPNKWLGFTYLTHLRNEFHVPAGSVVKEVSLDNK